jgi:hypothetical protein
MSEEEPGPAERRLRTLLARLGVEEDPKEAARLMREVARLTEALGRGEAVGESGPDV